METEITLNEFRIHLQNELANRCRRNARYSLRAFAHALDIDPSSVSQIISGKRRASSQMMEKICNKIGWPEIKDFSNSKYTLLTEDVSTAIADWYHYAILELTFLEGFRSSPNWIAKKLGITSFQAQLAIDRLLRLGILKKTGRKLEKGKKNYSNYQKGQTSSAHKEYQRQILQKSLAAIDSCDPSEKDITCINIAADSTKLEAAKEMIMKFRRELCSFLEDGNSDSVYVMAVQLYPLSFKEKDND